MKKIFLASLLVVNVAELGSAFAGPESFKGFYMGALVGQQKNTLKFSDPAHGKFQKDNGVHKMSGLTYGANIGYGWHLQPRFYVGLDLSVLSGLSKNRTYKETARITHTTRISEKPSGALMVQVGSPFGNFLPYVEAGIQRSSQNFVYTKSETGVAEKRVSFSSRKPSFAFGGGFKYKMDHVMFTAGYRFSKASNSGNTGTQNLSYKTSGHKMLVGVSYVF